MTLDAPFEEANRTNAKKLGHHTIWIPRHLSQNCWVKNMDLSFPHVASMGWFCLHEVVGYHPKMVNCLKTHGYFVPKMDFL